MKWFKDMDDNQYWLTVWSMAAVVAFTITTCVTLYNVNESNHIAALITQGKDPLAIACVYESAHNEATCALLAGKRVETK